ncbi:MAG: CvpA family protein [Candidatus Buchananbacteria bacterium]
MAFTLTDVILLVIVLAFTIGGFFAGFIRTVGAIIGFFAGAWVASRYFGQFGDWLTPFIGGHPVAARVIAFLILFILINRVIAIAFLLIGKLFDLISFIPFLKTLNRLAGLILGLAEGILVTGLLIYVIAKIAPDIPFISNNLAHSQVANFLVSSVAYMSGWALPEAMIKMQSIFK